MRVSQDYAGNLLTATGLATILKDAGRKELTVTVAGVRKHEFKQGEKPKYVLAFVGKTMEAAVSKTNAFALANDLGDDASNWPGHKVVLSTSFGQTPNGMGHIMHMRGILVDQQRIAVPSDGANSANDPANSYAAASQPASGQPLDRGAGTGADLNDEIPF